MKKFEIWIGNYHLGQGHHGSASPQKVGEQVAINFTVACLKYELKTKLDSLTMQELHGSVEEQSLEWWYNWRTNSNSWLGKYYESKEEAWESFPQHMRPDAE